MLILLRQGVMRSGGYAGALDSGRAARKRIRNAKKSNAEPATEDKQARNRARKARKKARKGLQAAPEDVYWEIEEEASE